MIAKAQAHTWRGETVASLRAAETAQASDASAAQLRMTATRFVAIAASKLGDNALLATCAERALAALTSESSSDEMVGACASICALCFFAASAGIGSPLAERLDRLATGDEGRSAHTRARIIQLRAYRMALAGDLEPAFLAQRDVGDAFDEAGDPRNAANARINTGYGLLLLGANEESIATLRSALATVTRMSLSGPVSTARQNLGLALGRLGAFAEAEQFARAAVDDFAAGGDVRGAAISRIYLTRILLGAGRIVDAEAEALRTDASLPSGDPLHKLSSVALADVLIAKGDGRSCAEALVIARAAYAQLAGETGIASELTFVRRVYIDALEASGLVDEARIARDEARSWLSERAARIRSAHYRVTFLTGEPDNARIMGSR